MRIRKPKVDLGGPLDYAAVEIWRQRPRLPAPRGAAATGFAGRTASVTSIVGRLAVAQDLEHDRVAGRRLGEDRVERMLDVDRSSRRSR